MEYKKQMLAGEKYNILQCYDSGITRIVPESRHAYASWLAAGNTPVVIPYVSPVLSEYKQAKADWIRDESARRVAVMTVYRSTGGVAEKMTQDVRDSLHAELTYITNKRSSGQSLIAGELVRETYLLGVWASIGTIQGTEKLKCAAVSAATTIAEVDAVTWLE